MGLVILGTGKAVPRKGRLMTNADIIDLIHRTACERGLNTADFVHLFPDWYVSRVGVRERYFAPFGSEATTSMAVDATRDALSHWRANHNLTCAESMRIHEIYAATVTPDNIGLPSTAHAVHAFIRPLLPFPIQFAMDVNVGCSGFLAALLHAHYAGYARREKRRFLLIGSEQLSRILDFTDPDTAGVFGDGAGAVIVEWDDTSPAGIVDVVTFAEGNTEILTAHSQCVETVGEDMKIHTTHQQYVVMDGKAVFEFAVREGTRLIEELFERNHILLSEIQHFFLHQANDRIRRAIAKRLHVPEGCFYSNIARYGNTSAASIPICLAEAEETGLLKPESLIILEAFGAGLGAIAMLMRL